MTPERWRQIEQIYHSALEREESQRASFLKEACAGDEELRREVESLLAQRTEAENFIEAPALQVAAEGMARNSDQVTVSVRSQDPSRVGQTVSHYRIVQKLGEGGMGVVYKAQDLKLERWVALKFLPPHVSLDAEAKVRFIREAKAASALDHPNIGTIHEIAETDDRQMFIVMAYYEGETLKQKIERGPLPLSEAVDLALQMARGLAKAHDQQIVHRDIKPSNVVVTRDGLVKIIDFGLAKLGGLTKITQTHTTMGTVAYMSPEQARGEEVDQRADVWSLGVVLYEMLAGQLPFPGSHADAIIHSILTLKPKPLKQLRADAPVEIERIIHRSLEKNLNSRYASGTEVSKDLSDCQSSLASTETRPGGGKLLSAWIRQKRVAIPGLLILLVLGSLLGWLFHRQAKIRWAREQAVPEISRLIDEAKYGTAFDLARQIEKYIPTDPGFFKLWPAFSKPVSIQTLPSGAEVYMKDYGSPDSMWTYLGRTPLDKVKIPLGLFRWRIKKEGFTTAEDVASAWLGSLPLALDQEGRVPAGMVHVPSTGSPFSLHVPGFEHLKPVHLPDYWIDKYEVTNKQYKEFIDRGGYQRREYWKHPFLKEGRELSWQEAMAEFHDATGRPGPSTWEAGDYPKGKDDYPVSGVSWYEAAAYAEFAGKSLPTIYHWNNAAITVHAWMSSYMFPLSNFSGQGPARVGTYQGMSRFGTYDMAGNVKEWCWNEAGLERRYTLGGAWDEPAYMFNYADARSPFHRFANLGFRCMKGFSGEAISQEASQPVLPNVRNYDEERPVAEETFRAYRSFYFYDKAPLDSVVESTVETDPDWKKEKVNFAAAYGNERIIACLFLPRRASAPYQTVIHFPGADALSLRSSSDLDLTRIDFIIKSGRAVLWPILKSTFERGDEIKSSWPNTSISYRDHVIYWSKDLARSIDYLETRPEIDHSRIGYYGFSWGATMGALMPALENRFKVSVLTGPGLSLQRALPEVDAINFAPRVTIPTLMLNGRYDFNQPIERSQVPMYRFLGTPREHKRHAVFEAGHVIPRNQLIKETLDWLDRYLGPVEGIKQ